MLLGVALRVGYPSVRHLLATGITSNEVVELAAYEWLEPDVGQRIDEGFASLMSIVYGRTRGKGERSMRPHEFMPKRGPVDREALRNKIMQQFKALRRR